MEGRVKNDLDVLKLRISRSLAPAILDIMEGLGYDKGFKFHDNQGAEFSLRKDYIQMAVEDPDRFFAPYISSYDSAEDAADKTHRSMLVEFNIMKFGFEALLKRKREAGEAIKWIDSIGTIYERKVITEKFNRFNA